jgi:hypothetical protein
MATAAEFHVKARKPGSKRYSFLTPRGGLVHNRIHAAIFTEEAATKTVELNASREGWDFLVVSA